MNFLRKPYSLVIGIKRAKVKGERPSPMLYYLPFFAGFLTVLAFFFIGPPLIKIGPYLLRDPPLGEFRVDQSHLL